MMQIRILVIATMLLLIAVAKESFAGPNKEIRDWYVWCDHALECTMQTGSEPDVYASGFIRSAEPNSEAVFFISTAFATVPQGTIEIVIDDHADEAILLNFTAGNIEDGVMRFPGRNLDNALLDAMMQGNKMQLLFSTKSGERRVAVSLSGVTGSALFIDEAQDRLGDRDALKAKGDGEPKGYLSRTVDLVGASALPKPVADLWRSGPESCAEGRDKDQDLIADLNGMQIRFENKTSLFILPCGLPGAYNFPQTVILFDPETQNARKMVFPVMGRKGPTITDFIYNVDWDDRQSKLSAFFKGRGFGDCGSRQVWEWPEHGDIYSNFELVEEYIKDTCDGNHDDWPQIWPPG